MPNLWPKVTYQEIPWTVPQGQSAQVDAFTRLRLDRPYRAAVVPPIASADLTLDAQMMVVLETAMVEIAHFDQESAALPVPMPAVLLRTEASSSSQIEHLTANARNLAIGILGLPTRQNAELVAANAQAMQQAIHVGTAITPQSILAIHSTLLGQSEPEIAGKWRHEQVWIGSSSLSPHGADFVPPPWEAVPEAVDDLCLFAQRTDIPLLAQAALLHAQFETIHPFVDGNGRVGRTLIHTLLRTRGLTKNSTVPVSSGLLRDTLGYTQALMAFREGDPAPIIRAVALAGMSAIANGRQLASDILAIRKRWLATLEGTRADSSALRLVDALFAQPVVTTEWISRHLAVSDVTAAKAARTLQEAGILTQSSSGRRNRLWQSNEALAAIDAFSVRTGRQR